jgi:hypothetical protein
LRSAVEFLLATYVLAWTWLVGLALALSPARLVARGWLVAGLGLGVCLAAIVWIARGRPAPPSFRPALRAVRDALRNRAVVVLAVAVAIGTAYSIALAFFTPVNEWDALSYHLARAAFWAQQQGLGYIPNAAERRLNGSPPNAEIGQISTMLLSKSDRYVSLPQLFAFAALVLSVAGISRRAGFGTREACFAALAFATLPLVVLQASGALNDLVVASFLASGAFFALGSGRASLLLLALAVGLAVGTKFTGALALPTLALIAAVGRPGRRWPAILLAGLAGIAAGSTWYVVNVVETGKIDGGIAEGADQRAELSLAAITSTAARLAVSFVDMSGAEWPSAGLYFAAGCVLAGLGALHIRASRRTGVALLTTSIITASVSALPLVGRLAQQAAFDTWTALGRPEFTAVDTSWSMNLTADPTRSWFGPVGAVLLILGPAAVVVQRLRGKLPRSALALSFAPWALLFTLALTIVWDPWRGRFLVFGVALAAATWGALLRSTALASAVAVIGAITLALTLADYLAKPLGLGSERAVWGDARWQTQARLRGDGTRVVLRFVEEQVPKDSRMAISLRPDDFVFPYFGHTLDRHVSLVSGEGGTVPADAEWLVRSPGLHVNLCPDAWRRELALKSGWLVERRIRADACPRRRAR